MTEFLVLLSPYVWKEKKWGEGCESEQATLTHTFIIKYHIDNGFLVSKC